jgi:hypothetical protein
MGGRLGDERQEQFIGCHGLGDLPDPIARLHLPVVLKDSHVAQLLDLRLHGRESARTTARCAALIPGNEASSIRTLRAFNCGL